MEKPVDFISRNWRKYNKKLVKRGEFYLLSDFIQYWDEELAHMNENKRGSPFEFPPSFIDFAAFLKIVFNLPYRQLQGVIKKLSTYVAGLQSADYTTLWRRIRATTFEIEPKKAQTEGEKESETEGVIAAIDATRNEDQQQRRMDERKMEEKKRMDKSPYHCRCTNKRVFGH